MSTSDQAGTSGLDGLSIAHGALFTDLYELTMLQAYFEERMLDQAVFSLFVRRLPKGRNFLVACGLDTVLAYLENLHFTDSDLRYLRSLDQFSDEFLRWLSDFRFTGEVRAVPEGTPVFADEPLLEITAPLPEAQVIETFVMNQLHLQTMLASKAYRVVRAAAGRPVVDFGARRMHGTDAALKAARAFHIAGVAATSNVQAGRLYGIPVSGTMAHSYVQAHENELTAFEAFANRYPETVLLVDTFDTLAGIENVIELARRLGDRFRVSAVRLDSGDLETLARAARRKLDDAGLKDVEIFASGGLDEYAISDLLQAEAPIDGFGVGTRMGVSSDAPSLDVAYKLTEYAGMGRVKLSPDKPILPGAKQIFRFSETNQDVRDVIGVAGEDLPGRPLLRTVMKRGKRVDPPLRDLTAPRIHAQEQISRLPERIRDLGDADPPYPVELTKKLSHLQQILEQRAADLTASDDGATRTADDGPPTTDHGRLKAQITED